MCQAMSIIAIITARGGSKRIPRKNVRDFCGKPILIYSIEAALNSGIFDEVMVSTDDSEIAEIAKKAGASVPFMRSEATSGDFATTSDVLKEVIDNYKLKGHDFDYICCIYPTAPFVTATKLAEAFRIFKESGADSLLPVVRFSFPPQRGVVVKDNLLSMVSPQYLNSRSQDLEPMYHDCGQFSFVNAEAFFKSGKIIMDKTAAMIISEAEVQDIDTEEDWMIAEMKYKLMNK